MYFILLKSVKQSLQVSSVSWFHYRMPQKRELCVFYVTRNNVGDRDSCSLNKCCACTS